MSQNSRIIPDDIVVIHDTGSGTANYTGYEIIEFVSQGITVVFRVYNEDGSYEEYPFEGVNNTWVYFVRSDVSGSSVSTTRFSISSDGTINIAKTFGSVTVPVETDPSVPAWAKQPNKPSYTADEVGALPNTTNIPSIKGLATEKYVDAKIQVSDTEPTDENTEIWINLSEESGGSDGSGSSASSLVNAHNTDTTAHADIREAIKVLSSMISGEGDVDNGYETVDSVAQMTDTTKSYILSSTGTLWSYLPTEVLEPKIVSVPIVSSADNLAVNNARLTSTKSADYVSTNASGYVTSPYIFLDQYANKGEITLRMGGSKQWIYELSSDAPSYARALMTDANNDSVALISNVSPNATWKDDSTKTTTFNGTEAIVKLNLPYYYNSKEVKRMRFSTSGGAWVDGDITVEYTDYETVMGDPDWVDTGLAVAEITEYSLANTSVKNFMEKTDYSEVEYSKSNVTTYCGNEYYRKDYPLPVVLTWNADRMAVDYAVSLEERTGSVARIYYSKTNQFTVYNLKPNMPYQYKVTALLCNGIAKLVKEGDFTTLSGTRMIKIDGIQNVRDIGGYTGKDGRTVKYDMIFRGSAMDEEVARNLCISDNGKHEMLKLGISTDIDLRAGHTESPLGIDFINTQSGYENYASAFTVNAQKTNFKNLLEAIVTQLTAGKPCYIHCQGGCDRTGTLIFQLLGLLGVGESDLAKEYELSSFSPIGYTRTRNSEKYIGMVNALETYSGDTITAKFEAFAADCNVSTDTIDSFRSLMLTN